MDLPDQCHLHQETPCLLCVVACLYATLSGWSEPLQWSIQCKWSSTILANYLWKAQHHFQHIQEHLACTCERSAGCACFVWRQENACKPNRLSKYELRQVRISTSDGLSQSPLALAACQGLVCRRTAGSCSGIFMLCC